MQESMVQKMDIHDDPQEFNEALNLVAVRYTGQRQLINAPSAVKKQFGQLFAFTDNEVKELTALQDLIVRYVGQRSPSRPLCLAVFGPPGSGKSFAVKQLRKVAEETVREPKPRLPLTTVNLTQVSDSVELGRVIARIAGEQDEETVPIVFFDEFDAPRNNAPFGWLQWFLAPMHDGEFLHEGAVIRLKRAIYVFAGGTADTMNEFSSPKSVAAFRAAKGPDFISRLRGYLDVQGPNAEHRFLRRAVLFHNEFQDWARRAGKVIDPDPELLKSLLSVGRYRHGARSIAAIAELSDLGTGRFSWEQLPEDHLVGLHIDRGPLDFKQIAGSIALSGYQSGAKEALATTKARDNELAACWVCVAGELWRHGATLSYGGSWTDDAGGLLTNLLATDLKKLPLQPSRKDEVRNQPSPWLVSFGRVNTISGQPGIAESLTPDARSRYGLQLVITDYLTEEERKFFERNTWSARLVERFRRRLAVSESSVARFAVAGATENHGGRVPGIAEELMLTMAMNKPVYVAGGFGGAALEVGALLGLGRFRSGDIPPSLKPQPNETDLNAIADKLRPGPWILLPITAAEITSFFKTHAIGGPLWPDNGLTTAENRTLFDSSDSKEVARLVAQGLRRRFADGVEAPPSKSDLDIEI